MHQNQKSSNILLFIRPRFFWNFTMERLRCFKIFVDFIYTIFGPQDIYTNIPSSIINATYEISSIGQRRYFKFTSSDGILALDSLFGNASRECECYTVQILHRVQFKTGNYLLQLFQTLHIQKAKLLMAYFQLI